MIADRIACDVAIIGGGTAGLAAERSARRAGATTLLIDPVFAGTTCANVGCMPSKLLIAAARAARTVTQAATFGLETTLRVDGPAVLQRLRKERDRFAQATREEIAELPPGVTMKAEAHFIDASTLELDDGPRISAKAIVIAAGARPSISKSFEAVKEFLLTNETIFELEDLPKTLAVIGAGPLGLELAQAMARLGVAVTLFDEGKAIAGIEDEGISGKVKSVLEREFDIHLDVQIEADSNDGQAVLSWSGSSSGKGTFDNLLVAAGRPPSLTTLALEAAGIALDEHGTPIFDPETMRCGESAIFIAGDADADRALLHEASNEGAIAGANAATYPDVRKARRWVPLSIMFTEPPLAVLGRKAVDDPIVGTADYADQGRAVVEAQTDGLAQILAAPRDGRLLGATLFCPGADHIGHLLAWSIETGVTADELLDRPFYHPTFEEGLKPALRSICKQLGLKMPNVSDEGGPSGA